MSGARCLVCVIVGAVFVGCSTPPETDPQVDVDGPMIGALVAQPGTSRASALIESIADESPDISRLSPEYIYTRLMERADSQEISEAFDRLLVGDMPALRRELLRLIELEFVHAADTSSLDLVGPELSEHFGDFEWDPADYPGGPEGPNEKLADMLTDALDLVTPERRANRTRTAVITRDEATDAIWAYMLDQWVPVPGEGDWKLNRHAMASYLKMRDAAAADGVELKILSGHRDPEVARRNAAAVGNSFAVASFSSHSLGLAIDFVLPKPESEDRFPLATRPMGDVVDMRRSPVHKWLHLYGRDFGWYPFQHEPWHWEFNPPGFRDVFFAEFPDGPPPRESGG
ncbi:MAG: D-alanyl-D-alanine carboxypeptidase family protein [Planctomycetota bacterium]